MAWTWYQKGIAVLMIVTGSINVIGTKWADVQPSVGRYGGLPRFFDHPFLQACFMFLGELLCLILFKILILDYMRRKPDRKPSIIEGKQDFNPFIFYAPAMCDMLGTSIMYIGLNLTNAVSFQMLRGSIIVFTGLFSMAFLKRKLKLFEWIGIAIVVIGLACVGVADFFYSGYATIDTNKFLLGDLLIIVAHIVVATQMVVEEKFVKNHNINPLQGVGWEGVFGFVTLAFLLIPMYFVKVSGPALSIFHSPCGRLEDTIDGLVQIANNWQIAAGLTVAALSIAFFNFAGLTVTKELSATTRMVLDSVVTLVIWIFSLLMGWQHFNYLQLVGFVILLVGVSVYNDVIIRPAFHRCICRRKNEETTPILKGVDDGAISFASPHFHASKTEVKPGSINA